MKTLHMNAQFVSGLLSFPTFFTLLRTRLVLLDLAYSISSSRNAKLFLITLAAILSHQDPTDYDPTVKNALLH